MSQVLRNIREVEMIESRLLRNIITVQSSGQDEVLLRYWRNWQKLPTIGHSECNVTSSIVNKTRLYNVKLTFHLADHLEVGNRILCFLITTVSGERYLIGTSERPFPIVTTEDVMPSRDSDKSGCIVTVEYKDTFGLLKVRDE